MRLLLGPGAPRAMDAASLRDLLAWPDGGGIRANFVSTLDGAATGADGVSGSINDAADKIVFDALRSLADCVLVGAGTARAEGYQRLSPTPGEGQPATLVLVSRSGEVPDALVGHGGGRGRGILVTCAASGRTASDDVWVLGDDTVDLTALHRRLRAERMPRILAEGGPHLFTDLLTAGLVDELCLTLVPTVVGGDARRITVGGWVDLDATPVHLLEEGGTLLGRWRLSR